MIKDFLNRWMRHWITLSLITQNPQVSTYRDPHTFKGNKIKLKKMLVWNQYAHIRSSNLALNVTLFCFIKRPKWRMSTFMTNFKDRFFLVLGVICGWNFIFGYILVQITHCKRDFQNFDDFDFWVSDPPWPLCIVNCYS